MTRSVFNHRRGASARYATEVLSDGPLLYWRLGEASGTTAEDATANDRDGTYTNTASNLTYGQTGAIANDPDTCVRLLDNGSDHARIRRAASTDWDTSSFTIELWIKPQDTETNFQHLAQVAGYSGGSSTVWRWILCLRSTTANEPLQIRTADDPTFPGAAADTGGLANGTWYYIAVTWNGTQWEFFLNASSLGTHTGDGPASVMNQPFVVGADDTNSTGGDHFNGYIDEVALYGTALSSTRITAHYTAAT